MATKQDDYNEIVKKSIDAFKWWRDIPAPQRGELIRIYGNILRENLNKLGSVVTKECAGSRTHGRRAYLLCRNGS